MERGEHRWAEDYGELALVEISPGKEEAIHEIAGDDESTRADEKQRPTFHMIRLVNILKQFRSIPFEPLFEEEEDEQCEEADAAGSKEPTRSWDGSSGFSEDAKLVGSGHEPVSGACGKEHEGGSDEMPCPEAFFLPDQPAESFGFGKPPGEHPPNCDHKERHEKHQVDIGKIRAERVGDSSDAANEKSQNHGEELRVIGGAIDHHGARVASKVKTCESCGGVDHPIGGTGNEDEAQDRSDNE